MQDFVVMGVQQGIQQVSQKETITDEILEFKLGEEDFLNLKKIRTKRL